MAPKVRFIICAGEDAIEGYGSAGARSDAGTDGRSAQLGLVSARILMQVGDDEVDLGLRPLDVTLNRLLDETPLMISEAAEEVFSQWLWQKNPGAARLYREALDEPGQGPTEVAWGLRGPAALGFPDLPVEALLGHRSNPVAVYREVPQCPQPLSGSVSSYLPPLGVWTVAPVSLLPRRLLPTERDPAVEYDAIVKRRLPTLEVLDIEYGPTRERLGRVLERLGEANVHVLHLITDRHPERSSLLLQDGSLDGVALAGLLAAGKWPELQLIVISAPGGSSAAGPVAWPLMRLVPVPAVLSYQGQQRLDSCLLPFTERFYGALAAGYSVLQATTHARLSMRDSGRAETVDVLSPTLFLRADTDAPAIRAGDPGLEGLLTAADAIAAARDILDNPEVFQLAENIPAALAQMHNRLIQISERNLEQLRLSREQQNRLVRQAADRDAPTYTAHAAVAEQLHRVLSMAPAPASGADNSRPASPPGLDWLWVLQRAQPELGIEQPSGAGPDRLLEAADLRWLAVERDAERSAVRIVVARPGERVASATPDLPTGVYDLSQWPPPLNVARADSEDDREVFAQLERDLAAAAAQVVRSLLRFHFRRVLGVTPEPNHMPRGLMTAELLRGGLATLGIRVADVELPDVGDAVWPRGAYLLEDLDERTRCVVILRPDPEADYVASEAWASVAAYWEQACGQHGGGCAVYLDVWPTAMPEFWQPARPIAPPSTPSWVWDQLPRAIGEYRELLLQRLWEWWIGALSPENGDV